MQITRSQTIDLLKKANHIVITSHVNPDGDSIGSSLGLMHYLKTLNKKVTIFIDDDIPANFSVLPGFDEIERVPEGPYEADLLVLLDTSLDRVGNVNKIVSAPVLNIDHHISNNNQADYLYLDATRAATAEIVFQLLKDMDAVISSDMALCIYTGIATDCGFFRFSNTSSFTMYAAGELIDAGAKPNIISEALEQKPFLTIKSIARAINTLEMFHDGKIAGVFLSKEDMKSCDSTEGFIDFVRIIEGVDVAVLAKYIDEGICRVSMRSKDTDVSKIAMAFGGGGHIRAAGCTIHKSLTETKNQIIAAIIHAMEEQNE